MAALVFGLAVVVQWNDPDPLVWLLLYALPAIAAVAAFCGLVSVPASSVLALAYLFASWWSLPPASAGATLSFSSLGMKSLGVEQMRESLGLAMGSAWFWILAATGWSARIRARSSLPLLVLVMVACTARDPSSSALPPDPKPAVAIEIPAVPERRILERVRVATGLDNPRGLLPMEDGDLLVSVAGDGDAAGSGSGGLLRLRDLNGDGRFEGGSEVVVLLGEQPSSNVVSIVRRDEVFGMADIARGGGTILVSLAHFGGPSLLYQLQGGEVTPWSRVHGNINDIEYDPGKKLWFAVSSSSDEIVRLRAGRGSTRVLKVPPLARGQDPVPGYLRHDPRTGDLLVTLFSGSPKGEEGGVGTEIEAAAGGIIRVDPEHGEMEWVVRGLTAPTDLAIGADGTIYVLELCDGFEDPVPDPAELWDRPSHGGFRRFSGRLLAVDRDTGGVEVLAENLDAPTNLALRGRTLYIGQGMGTPGRPIPGPRGSQPLTGFIERLELSPPGVAP